LILSIFGKNEQEHWIRIVYNGIPRPGVSAYLLLVEENGRVLSQNALVFSLELRPDVA